MKSNVGIKSNINLTFTSISACNGSLGMEDGRIPASQITASSEYDSIHGPANARLNRPAGDSTTTGAWSARTNDLLQWIQVDFGVPKIVLGIVLQGKEGDDDQWVTRYRVEYKYEGSSWLAARRNMVSMVSHQMVCFHHITLNWVLIRLWVKCRDFVIGVGDYSQ